VSLAAFTVVAVERGTGRLGGVDRRGREPGFMRLVGFAGGHPDTDLLKPTDIAHRLGVSRSWIYDAAKAGRRVCHGRTRPKTAKAPRLRGFQTCAEEDSNLHPVIPDQALNLARLPIPPSARERRV
jgi:predicted DNA-binding transcriptional regulator AlpA